MPNNTVTNDSTTSLNATAEQGVPGAFAGPSVWQGNSPATAYPPLQEDLRCDVAIVGGGITGMSLALQLLRRGQSVAVLEAWRVGNGTTGHSTGNLYETTSEGLHAVAERWDNEMARAVAAARRAALAFIAQEVSANSLDCGFRRCSHYRFALSDEARQLVAREEQALVQAGCKVRLHDEVGALPLGAWLAQAPLPGTVLEMPEQAQFHPLAYVQGLAAEVTRLGGRVFESSAVDKVDASHRSVHTGRGRVQARHIVLATHSPKGFHPVQAEMLVHREYAVALPLDGLNNAEQQPPVPPGVFWAMGQPHLSVRGLETADRAYLICVGQEHSTGNHDPLRAQAELAQSIKTVLGRSSSQAFFAWAAQNYRPADGLPYVGQDLSGCFIATGFGTDGLVWGTVAASLLAEQLTGQPHPLGDLLRPGRLSPVKGAKVLLQENLTVAKALVKDYLRRPPTAGPAADASSGDEAETQSDPVPQLLRGQGAILQAGDQEVAAYRAHDGQLTVVSPVCPHLKCKVRWNSAETSWDCPCHGSRFYPDGQVIEGPALEGLTRVSLHTSTAQAKAAS